ncbi:unnamed protein product [Hermetia illucens]|uniref:Uncharacterized protein n=1 Tax=Hermetia illucens TaxID=343691 RepID=A0A7R8UC27_HERIL|nr:uncharacterized protein LOC119647292 [Hermetia illucens]CAD7078020.1 unnamed protein product [Hermetia illucens]
MASKLLTRFYIFLTIILTYSNALRCYTCTYTDTSSDRSCITNPDAVIGQKFTSCSKKYCVIFRQELQKPAGVVNTFLRGCEDKPLYLNNVVEDPTFKSYYRSCTTDLCNNGDGIRSTGSSLDPDSGAGSNMIIPGRSMAGETCSKAAFLLMVSTLTVLLMSDTLWD